MMGYPTHYLHVRSDYYCVVESGGYIKSIVYTFSHTRVQGLHLEHRQQCLLLVTE